ncbi:hypothetical protein JCM5350_008184 [Sporobolomyces pararoseus]
MELPTPPPAGTADAPTYTLSSLIKSRRFTTVEYPSRISLSTTSLSTALSTLSPSLDKLGDLSKVVELDLSSKRANENPFLHKVVSTGLPESNNLVIRVTKRKRKVPKRDEFGNVIEEGQYKLEPVGIEDRLIRFRAMADFQYIPKIEQSDKVVNLVDGIRNLDINSIRSFKMPEPSEDFNHHHESNKLDLIPPPPIFSRHALPQNFNFRPAGGTVRITTEQGLTRLVNSTRYKVKTIQSILFIDEKVPSRPDESFLKELKRSELNDVEKRIKELLENERPVWTRLALLNQLTRDQVKYISNNKSVWPMVGYTFSDGPFRDLVVRFGYDPRKDPQARFYQHFILRNIQNVRTKALPGTKSATQSASASARHHQHYRGTQNTPTTTEDTNEGGGGGEINSTEQVTKKSHIFDGTQFHSKIGNFQLIDIQDPLSKALINSLEGVLPTCSRDTNEGWYAYDYLDQIKQVVRRKFMGLVVEGRKVEDKDCDDLLGWELSKKSRLDPTGQGDSNLKKGRNQNKSQGQKGKGKKSRRNTSLSSDEEEESSAVSTAEEEEQEVDSESGGGGTGSGSDSAVDSETGGEGQGEGQGSGSGSGSDNPTGKSGLKKKPRKPVRAPWELPRKKKRRPKEAETEEDMLARLQRKTRRRSTTTGLPSSSNRRDSFGSGDGNEEEG